MFHDAFLTYLLYEFINIRKAKMVTYSLTEIMKQFPLTQNQTQIRMEVLHQKPSEKIFKFEIHIREHKYPLHFYYLRRYSG